MRTGVHFGCEYAKTLQPKKIICIFDRDNPNMIKKIPDPFIDFGNNVYAFCIEKPIHRVDYNNISIEFLYTDKELQTADDNNKRLLFSNEVEKRMVETMTHKKAKIDFVLVDEPLKDDETDKKIYDQDVDKVIDGQGDYSGLSKSVFANYVLAEKPGYDDFDIEPFRRTFETIAEIIE